MRWQISIVALLVVPLAFAQQKPPLASVRPPTPTPGFRSADVEGQTIRYQCQGSGSPTVIIEQGGGISLETVFSWKQPVGWAAFVPKIAAETHVCFMTASAWVAAVRRTGHERVSM
jgi:hypothetical protein